MLTGDRLQQAVRDAIALAADEFYEAKTDERRTRVVGSMMMLEIARTSCNLNQDEHGYAMLCFGSGMIFDLGKDMREKMWWLDVVQPDRLRKAV